jgi:hypothetical protein
LRRWATGDGVGIEAKGHHLLALARPLLDRLQVVLALLGAFALERG